MQKAESGRILTRFTCVVWEVSGSLSLQKYRIISNTVNDVLVQGSATGHNYIQDFEI